MGGVEAGVGGTLDDRDRPCQKASGDSARLQANRFAAYRRPRQMDSVNSKFACRQEDRDDGQCGILIGGTIAEGPRWAFLQIAVLYSKIGWRGCKEQRVITARSSLGFVLRNLEKGGIVVRALKFW